MNNHNYLMALAMNSDFGTLRLGNSDIPVKIVEVESEGGEYSSSETTFKCLVVNDDQIKCNDPRATMDEIIRNLKNTLNSIYGAKGTRSYVYRHPYAIDRVIFHDPATIVYWADGTKTVVKCQDGDAYSKETGLALCFAKKALGNKGSYNDVFKQYLPKEEPDGMGE